MFKNLTNALGLNKLKVDTLLDQTTLMVWQIWLLLFIKEQGFKLFVPINANYPTPLFKYTHI